jgi:hypothetical protein
MVEGGKKDALYIASQFDPWIKKLDPSHTRMDCVFFDGASNVQKAGRVLEAKFPRLQVVHGAEHVASLFFADIAKFWQVRHLLVHYRRLYRLFGSGSMHSPYALFIAQTKNFNQGRKVGLLRASDVRMAGHFIALHRMLRLRHPIAATMASAAYKDLKLKGFAKTVEAFVADKNMWNAVYLLLRCIFPVFRVLRLADKAACGGMSKLMYYVRRTDVAMLQSKDLLEDMQYFKDKTELDAENQDEFDDEPKGEDVNGGDDDSKAEVTYGTAVSSDDDESDDESNNSRDDESGELHLGEKIVVAWEKRRKKLITPLSLAGWFCSPLPEIRQDVQGNGGGVYRLEVEGVIAKLYYPTMDEDLGNIIQTFWSEFNDFQTKQRSYARPWIWNSREVQRGDCHIWHKLYSLPFTEVFGVVACRVTSKIVGIGSAERSWGAVKHLKTGKRAHMKGDTTEMAATVFGAFCIDKARSERSANEHDGLVQQSLWTDADIAFNLGLESWTADEDITVPDPVAPRRIFNAWIEEWEYESIKKKDVVDEAKLLQKYGGLYWMDQQTGNLCVGDDETMEFQGGRNGAGWCLVAIQECDGKREPWTLPLVIDEIAEYSQPEEMRVEVVINETLRAANIAKAEEEEKEKKKPAKRKRG